MTVCARQLRTHNPLLGLSRPAACDFSFLLAIPTLTAATLYESFRSRHELFLDVSPIPLLIGFLVSFATASLVLHLFMRYIQKHNFYVFGGYRMVLGMLLLVWVALRS